jgi:hypothetical protein
MGWASDALFRDLGINPNARYTVVKSERRTKEETSMDNFRNIPQNADLVKVCDDRHIIGQTDKAIKVRIGQTLYGEPITTFYPKSLCQIRPKVGGGYDVFVPKWMNRDRKCMVGDFDAAVQPGFSPLPF